MNGLIFDIKEFAIHDGPGIRTTVFFKGCPLRCQWCHNPEGLSPKTELMTKQSKCRGCAKCLIPCTHEVCKPYGRCIYACPDALVSVCGKYYDTETLLRRLLKNEFFLRENGGVTFSGGEPLMQHEFLYEMLTLLHEQKIHTCIETSGYADKEIFAQIAENTDYIIMDIKLADQKQHKKYTGVSSEKILENAKWLRNSGKDYEFRTPLIKDITDTEENLSAIREIIDGARHVLIPYNTLAGAKYSMLGRSYALDNRNNH